MRKIAFLACLLVAFTFILSPNISAVETIHATTIEIPVSCAEENANTDNAYTIRIQATDNAPAPNETELKLKNNESGVFHVYVTEPGDYQYRITEEKPADINCSYDKTVYDVTAQVVIEDDMSMKTTIIASNDKSKEKPDEVRFINSYPESKPDNSKETYTKKDKVENSENTKKDAKQSNESIQKNPKTEDNSRLSELIAIVIISALGLVTGSALRKRCQ